MTSPPNIVSLVDLLESSAEKFGPRELFGSKSGPNWVYTTYAQFKKLADDMRGGLATLGVSRGDKVGVISNNRIEWAVLAYAGYGLGAAYVPMYESQLEKDWEYVVRDSEMKVLFVSTQAIYERTKGLLGKVPTLKHVALIAGDGPEPTYKGLLKKGSEGPVAAIHPESKETAALIYTSGTTGNPKGVILSHGNVISNLLAVHANLPIDSPDRSLAFLPWAHSFGHTAELHLLISIGASTGICESTDKIIDYLSEVQPTVLFAVPRIFNRIHAGVEKQMAAKPALIRALYRGGLKAATKKRENKPLGLREKVVLALADKLVFAKVRARFGGRMKYVISGAAALAREIAEFVDGLGITVYEGYGLTETSPIVSVNVPGARKMGSVGQPIPGCRVVIDRSLTNDPKIGEIVVYGPNVMQGYYKLKDDTAAVFTPDGGFRTGDLGYLDEENFLFITGRIKEQYKLENGKYVVPAPLEELVKLSPFVSNVMIYGDNKPFNVALLVPNLDTLKEWAQAEGLGDRGVEDLLTHERVQAKMKEELDRVSVDFKGYERVRKFALIAEDFTLANDMLTPKLSVKRRNVMQKWGKELERLYGVKIEYHLPMLFDLKGKVAIVTGGNGGLGLGMARGLASAGARVVVAARKKEKSMAAVAELDALGPGGSVAIEVDVTNESSVAALIRETAERCGRLDILVNNAGTNVRKLPQDLSLAEWHHVVDTNLTSTYLCSHAAYPVMKAGGSGKVVNVGSMMSIFGSAFTPAYAASKGGVVQLTKACASAWARDNIQVNAILPGWIDTELTQGARREIQGLHENVLRRTPAGRWGSIDDLRGIAVFLSGPASDFVTGAAITVDGGFSIQG